VGDALLCLVAQRLRRETREEDLLVRLGGDEFVILLANGDRAEVLAKRVVDLLSRPFLVEGQIANISASVGVARFPEHGPSADDLMRHADLALYGAKSAGGHTWRAFEPNLAAEANARRELETDLRKALALGELSLAYQAQINVRSRALTGFEALLRWTHPTRGDVSPVQFIPVAEDIGCIIALGEWVLKTACQEAAGWPAPLTVAVNVSPRQLADSERLFNVVQAALQASGLAPERLELEITETSLLSPDAHVLDTLHRFRAAGIRIAMDDFGTGYSSLSQLRSFPFDKIKIDRSFVAMLGVEDDAAVVIRAIAALGVGLGMTTTAEGVETAEQAALVAADGCTDIQGYLISRPIPATEIEALLRQHAVAPDNSSITG
jgi:predicted signal transduction protein with EAL and GGDEF domain